MTDENDKKNNSEDDSEIKVEIRDSKRTDKESEEAISEAGPEISSEPEESAPETVGEEYETKLKEQEDRYLRLAAEFENYKKRTARQFEQMTIQSAERIITPLLEVVDNFSRALEAAEKSSDFDSLKKGTELILQQIKAVFDREGLEEIPAVGEPFDPNLHEAMMQVESDEHDEGIIVQEIIRGYKLKGRVIRHSRVAVSKGSGNDGKDIDKDHKE